MAHQSQYARLQTLFDSALQAYEKKTDSSLAQHPLAIELHRCDTVDAITGLFRDQAQAFSDLQGSDKIIQPLKATISILSELSSAASLVNAFGLVRQKALMPCHGLTSLNFIRRHSHLTRRCWLVSLSYLTYVPSSSSCRWSGNVRVIQSAKGIISNCDALVDLLESIEYFLNRLHIYTGISPAPAIDEIMVKIFVELISTLALVTEGLKQRRSSESVLADLWLCSPPRSQICKELFQSEGH
jgi:hypothetical protein